MSTIIEARRLNGTDIGKSIDLLGVIESVTHQVRKFEEKTFGNKKSVVVTTKIVEVGTDRGAFVLQPSAKITISGMPSPKEGSHG